MNGDASQGGDGIISDALVSGNVIYGNAKFNDTASAAAAASTWTACQNSRIENNLLYNNHASGISLYRIDGGGGSSGNVVVNNTIYEAERRPLGPQHQRRQHRQHGPQQHPAQRPFVPRRDQHRADSLTGFTSDYNVVISRFTTNGGGSVQSLQPWHEATGTDQHSIVATAAQLFLNPAADASGNYHLLATAGAINTGTNQLAPMDDLDGLLRPVGAQVDIGAYEWRPAALAGDHNGDGAVDAVDYVAWRKAGGGHADYDLWRTNFGRTADSGSGATGSTRLSSPKSASAAVPEPKGILMVLIASLALVINHRPGYPINRIR